MKLTWARPNWVSPDLNEVCRRALEPTPPLTQHLVTGCLIAFLGVLQAANTAAIARAIAPNAKILGLPAPSYSHAWSEYCLGWGDHGAIVVSYVARWNDPAWMKFCVAVQTRRFHGSSRTCLCASATPYQRQSKPACVDRIQLTSARSTLRIAHQIEQGSLRS
jgi:hypothetical protein